MYELLLSNVAPPIRVECFYVFKLIIVSYCQLCRRLIAFLNIAKILCCRFASTRPFYSSSYWQRLRHYSKVSVCTALVLPIIGSAFSSAASWTDMAINIGRHWSCFCGTVLIAAHFVCRHCAVCVGSYNVHASERVVLLAHSDGTVQRAHHVVTQRTDDDVT